MIKRDVYCGLMVVLGVAVGPVSAQSTGYRPPGQGLEEPPTGSRRQRVETEYERARWKLGPIHLEPWLGVRNLVYSSGQGSSGESEIGVAAGGGLLGYLPMGSDFILTLQATPEYVWWSGSDDRSRGHQRYALDLYGFLNRLQLHFAAARLDDLEIASVESNEYISRREDILEGDLELRTYRRLHIFVEGAIREHRSLEDLAELSAFSRLDNRQTSFVGGLRLRHGDGFSVELGLERLETESLDPRFDRSSEGTYPFVGLVYDRARYLVRGRLEIVDLEPVAGSEFALYEGPTGEAGLLWRFGDRTSMGVQVSRDLTGSTQPAVSTIRSDRLDVSLARRLYRRTELQVFGQIGTDEYLAAVTGVVGQVDDVAAVGGRLSVPLGNALNVNFSYTVLDYDSNVGLLDRRLERLTVSLAAAVFGDVFSMR